GADGRLSPDLKDVHHQPGTAQKGHADRPQAEKAQSQSSQKMKRTLAEGGQERHCQQIKKSSQESSDSVFGMPERSRAMIHSQFRDAKTTGMGQNGDKTVKFSIELHFTGHLSLKNLDSAIVIVQFQAGQQTDHAVED